MAKNLQVLLIDQDPESRISLKRQLSILECAVVGEAHFGVEAITLARHLKPEAVLLHLEEPLSRGLQTIESIGAVAPNSPVVVLSWLGDTQHVQKAMVAGAKDYLVQPVEDKQIEKALHRAHEMAWLRRVAEPDESAAMPKAATVITVFGTKGGIGKTTLATNLALSIRQLTQSRALLIDLDMVFGDAALMLDLVPNRTIGNWLAARNDGRAEDFNKFVTEHSSGLLVLGAHPEPGLELAAPGDEVRALLQFAAQQYDYVIVDTPGTLNDAVQAALAESTLVLLVTTTDAASVKDTQACLDILQSWGFSEDQVKLAVNHANSANGVSKKDIEQVLNGKVFWSIPFDKAVTTSSQLGQPVVIVKPKASAARNLAKLAVALTGTHPPRTSWLRRILGR